MNPLINYIVVEFGIPHETVALLLLFPLITTVVAFLRQVVGVKAFGIYIPSIVALVFFVIGLKYGITIYVAVIAIGMATRIVLRRFRLLYLPRVAITMTFLSFTVLGVLMIGGWLQRTGFAAMSVFPLLVIVMIAEKFVAVQIEKGTKAAVFLAFETLAVALVGYWLLSSHEVRGFFLLHPWTVLLTIPANILLGKWTGLRLTEYFRFREVLKKMKK